MLQRNVSNESVEILPLWCHVESTLLQFVPTTLSCESHRQAGLASLVVVTPKMKFSTQLQKGHFPKFRF